MVLARSTDTEIQDTARRQTFLQKFSTDETWRDFFVVLTALICFGFCAWIVYLLYYYIGAVVIWLNAFAAEQWAR